MKTLYTISIIAAFAASSFAVNAQSYPDEYLGLPGDNLNLYAVMNLFQESETLEGFERSLNDEETMINNLDLNGDKLIDYITVSDFVEGKVHTIVMRAALNRKEQQDVAVFVVEELRNGAVQIQLIGDEALYGPNYIVEPIYAETPNPGYTGKVHRRNVNVVTTSYYDIGAWPVIRYMYHPRYVTWRSSWYWGYYPSYWRPWRAHYWHYYYGYHYHWHNHYYSHYRHWNRYRCGHYQTYYHSHVRVHSPTVVVNVNNNRYRSTYSRPESRRAGAEHYTRTASKRSNANRTVASASRTNSRTVATNSRQNVQRSATNNGRTSTRSTSVRTTPQNNRSQVRTSSQRSSSQRSTPTVQRSTSQSRSTVQRSQPSRSKSTVQRSQPSRSKSTVQRSQPSRSKSTVQRSQPSRSKSTVQRSQPSRSKSTVQRSQPSRSKSTVQRSQPSRSKSTVQRSQSSKSRSSAPSSSSRSSNSRSSSSRSARR